MNGVERKASATKILAALFAAIGLFVVVSIISQLISGSIGSQNHCAVRARSSFPSPQNEYLAELTYLTCGDTIATAEITFRRFANESEGVVLLRSRNFIETRGVPPYPPAISLNWESPSNLVISAPPEDIAQSPRESYGVSISYIPTK